MKTKFSKESASLAYRETDSLTYKIKGTDVYAEFKYDLSNWFDTSEYEINNPYGYPLLKKRIMGLMKDKLKGKILNQHVVVLRSEMYAIKVMNSKDECTANFIIIRSVFTEQNHCGKNKIY